MPNKVGGNEVLAAAMSSGAAACRKSALHMQLLWFVLAGVSWSPRNFGLVLVCPCAPFSSPTPRLFVGPTRRRVSHMQLSSPRHLA
jgi:hypothetical protein